MKPAAAEVAKPVADVFGDPSSIPPLVADISKQALKKRVERLMKPRQDGSFVVPEELVREWNGKTNQDLILKEFKESGLDKDHSICISILGEGQGQCCENKYSVDDTFLQLSSALSAGQVCKEVYETNHGTDYRKRSLG